MLRAAPERPYTVTFVNDWAAHLETLLPSMAFDASFPWTRPDCETPENLSAIELYSCQQYIYSDPFYEIVDGFFARADSGYDIASQYSDLQGAGICRPEGYPTSHLTRHDLMPPVVRLEQPTSVNECFSLLMSGEVDVVSLDTRTGTRVISELGLAGQVAEIPALTDILPLQIAAHTENPDAQRLITALNSGLREMHVSGEWRAIISDALQSEFNKRAGDPMN